MAHRLDVRMSASLLLWIVKKTQEGGFNSTAAYVRHVFEAMRLQEIQQGTSDSGGVMYKIVRMYFDTKYEKQVIKKGLTLDEAQVHCQDLETSSRTCTKLENRRRTKQKGPWFDGYEKL